MFEIINKQILAENIKRIDVYAPNVAQKFKPGQYVSVCPEEGDERIPLSLIEADGNKGTITLILQEIGQTTGKLGSLPINESIFSILGPLGVPATVEKKGLVVCIATGIGAAKILPICRALKNAGNKVVGIIGAKNKKSIMLESQMRLSCNKVHIATEDGSYENKGTATDILVKILENQAIHLIYAIGSVRMMENICSLTKAKKIKTFVQLSPVMVDCVGMCGSCRVKVGGKIVLACTDGPEFNGHEVDFQELLIRKEAFEGLDECHKQKLHPNPQRKESTILTRFLSGILKKMP